MYKLFSTILRLNAPDKLNQFSSNFFFHKLRLCEPNLESTLNDLVDFSASLENVLINRTRRS